MPLKQLFLCFLICLTWQSALADGALAKVRLQLKWHHQFQFAGYYTALEKGYYRDAGLDVDILPAEPGQDSIRSVLDGKADFGVGTSDLLLHRQQGDPVVALAVIFQHSPLALMARHGSGLSNLHDLAGRKLMIEPGSAELFAYLNRENLPQSRFTLMPHGFSPADLVAGKVDGMSVYVTDEPFELAREGRAYTLYSPRAGGIDFYGDTLFTTEGRIRQNPEQVRAFRAASLKGWAYAMAHPGEIAELIYARYSQRHSLPHLLFEAEQMKPLLQISLVEPGHMNPGRWHHMAEVYAELGMMKPGFDPTGFIYDAHPPQVDRKPYVLVIAGILLLALLAGSVALHIHRTNRKLRLSRERQATIFNNAPMAFVVSDQNQIILDWNRAAERIFGWTRQEARGRHIYDLLVPESDRPQVETVVHTTLQQGVPTQSVNRNMTRDGRVILCEWQNAEYLDEQLGEAGNMILSVGVDITERRALEDSLHQAKEKAEQLLADQRQFMAMISHEFRSPLAVIDSASQVLELQTETESPSSPVVGRIRRGVRRLANFLDNCLTEDRLDTRGWELHREPVALDDFLPRLMEQAQLSAPRHSLELQHGLSGTCLQADPNLLSILFQNLLDNAVKYSPEGSRVILRSQITNTGWLALEVEDRGIGIALEDREHVLEKYYRGKNTAQVSGAGLGLSLVARIVGLHGGRLSIADGHPGGTRVIVELPLTES